VSVSLHDRGIRVVLLDIEGTTTPMAFVYEVLFPYARARLASYLRAHITAEDLRDELATLRVEWQEEARKGEEPPPWALADVPAAARYLEWLMDRDRKSPSLKRIQGWIWQEGFSREELHGDLFPDVAPAFARWKQSGLDIAIYSSGSVLAQRLIFSNELPSITAFFDTAVGPKRSVDSYTRIAKELGKAPAEILFVSDVPEELNAALDAGMQIVLAVRPGNTPVDGPTSVDEVSTFEELLS
jgi:enolase-phosphatase E1